MKHIIKLSCHLSGKHIFLIEVSDPGCNPPKCNQCKFGMRQSPSTWRAICGLAPLACTITMFLSTFCSQLRTCAMIGLYKLGFVLCSTCRLQRLGDVGRRTYHPTPTLQTTPVLYQGTNEMYTSK